MRKFLLIILVLICAGCASADDLIDSSSLNMRKVEDMNMSGILPAYVKASALAAESTEAPEYNLSRMKQMNPDFTTYPEAFGIIWRKHCVFVQHGDGGLEVVRQYVILGRKGLPSKWLNWNIPIPNDGTAEILEASVYDFNSLAQIATASQNDNPQAGVITVNFSGLPETFILAVCWREKLPQVLSVEGVSWFQEDLRVWEAVIDVYSPQQIAYRVFPAPMSPEIQRSDNETAYTWRRINLEPLSTAGELARLERSGAAFSTRRGKAGALAIAREAEGLGQVPADSEALAGFKRNKTEGTLRLINWLKSQPTIELAEGSPRKIPANSPLTRAEKVILARSWLTAQKVEASLSWQLPFEPEETTPICAGMFSAPVLELQGIKGMEFHDLTDPKLLAGAKIYSITSEGRVFSRRIPSTKPADNRLSAIMDLQLTEYGLLNGTVRVILRGGWGALLLGNNPTDGMARGALLSLFPGLTNYKDVKLTDNKGIPELTFTVDNKPGVGGTGRGILAILPFFEPVAMRKLGGHEAPVEILFPFVVDQNITLGFPKNASQALVSGKVSKNPDKINYSESYTNRRHRLIAEARFEVNMPTVTSGNMSLLRRHLDNWRAFSARQIPVR